MQTRVFSRLKQKVECDTGSDLETIGFRSKNGIYEMSFYGSEEDDYKVIVEDFGCMKNQKWYQLEPTETQIITLQNIINKEADNLYKLKEQKEQEDRITELDAKALEETKSFINANFYRIY
ncbi:hypothetical protein [Tenacibaculum sp. C7A-26P2]|uniref:hypothetical protein n=1 Tax=Tenacibaculum sp. C7A-26P2 TaxID=3447504 RepID=UPI003F82C85B